MWQGEDTRTPQTAASKNVLPLREVGERSWSILASQQGKRSQLMRVLSGDACALPQHSSCLPQMCCFLTKPKVLQLTCHVQTRVTVCPITTLRLEIGDMTARNG